MKAVLASAQFQSLDDDGDGLLQVDDLVRAFAGVGGVSFEQALAMANLVMRAATEDRRVAADKAAAKADVEEMCRKLLANTVIENFTVEVTD
jgi:Ca2+-binding EF-hand superfamily protein